MQRSRRDPTLPCMLLPFHHTCRLRCSTSLHCYVCSRVLRHTGRSGCGRCMMQWKWIACCKLGDYCCGYKYIHYSSNNPVGGSRKTPPPPPQHPDPCSSLLPRTLLCPKSDFDCSWNSWTHNLLQLLDSRMDRRPSFGRSHHQASSNKLTLWYLCMSHYCTCKPLRLLLSHLS